MKIALDLHPVQYEILKVLLFKPEARFSELNTTELTNDHFNFHVKTLLNWGLIAKLDSGKYILTDMGKEFANRFDTDNNTIERQPKLTMSIICIKIENGVKKYLLQQRLKQPFFGYYGGVTGKIKWGETVQEGAARELLEETGLTADLTLVGITHRMDNKNDGETQEDKYFFAFRGENVRGNFTEEFEGGKNFWFSYEELIKLDKLFRGMLEAIEILERDYVKFSEQKYILEEY
jgi:ADP-ribose pyrophosphatase YjhB (NUDIX family)